MKKILLLTFFCFSSCGQSKEDAPLDSNVGDISNVEDLADMQSPDLFDDFEAHKKYCLQYENKKQTCENDPRCTSIIGARCGSGLVTCVPVPLACGQLVTAGRSPDGICYVYG